MFYFTIYNYPGILVVLSDLDPQLTAMSTWFEVFVFFSVRFRFFLLHWVFPVTSTVYVYELRLQHIHWAQSSKSSRIVRDYCHVWSPIKTIWFNNIILQISLYFWLNYNKIKRAVWLILFTRANSQSSIYSSRVLSYTFKPHGKYSLTNLDFMLLIGLCSNRYSK